MVLRRRGPRAAARALRAAEPGRVVYGHARRPRRAAEPLTRATSRSARTSPSGLAASSSTPLWPETHVWLPSPPLSAPNFRADAVAGPHYLVWTTEDGAVCYDVDLKPDLTWESSGGFDGSSARREGRRRSAVDRRHARCTRRRRVPRAICVARIARRPRVVDSGGVRREAASAGAARAPRWDLERLRGRLRPVPRRRRRGTGDLPVVPAHGLARRDDELGRFDRQRSALRRAYGRRRRRGNRVRLRHRVRGLDDGAVRRRPLRAAAQGS